MTEREVRMVRGHPFPANAVTQTFGLLGRRGSGKTYGAGKLVEGLDDVGAQVVVLDPVGNWYGLRLAADGQAPGLTIPILGGEHGDIPLESTAGVLVANLIVDENTSMVLDLSSFRKAERKRFVADFAEQLFHRKKTARTPLHVVFEEAQVFAPQRTGKGEERMLGAVEDIVRLGRNYGIGSTLISQRPQSVNKEVLNQVEALFVFQISGPQERKAIEAWVVDKGIDVREMVDALPSLPVGEAYLWSPQWLGFLDRVRILKKRTFDASSTPELGVELTAPRELAPVKLDALRDQMAETIAQARANDPKLLKVEVARLTRELAERREPEPVVERVEVSVVSDGDRQLLKDVGSSLEAVNDQIVQLHSFMTGVLNDAQLTTVEARSQLTEIGQRIDASTTPTPSAGVAQRRERPVVSREAAGSSPVPSANGAVPDGDAKLGRPERAFLNVLAQFPHGRTKAQLSVLSGYSGKSSSFANALGRLRTMGLVDRGDPIRITPAGLAAIGPVEPLPTGRALLDHWCGRLSRAERAMLSALHEAYPRELDNEAISEATGYSLTSSSFANAIGKLRTLELAVGYTPSIRAADVFFELVPA